MYDKIVQRGVDFIYKYADIAQQDREVYQYGIELVLMYLINAGTLLLISLPVGHFFDTLALLTGFALIQSFGGGYHAKTHLKCFLWMLAGWVVSMLILPFYSKLFAVEYISILVGLFFIFEFAPVQHKNFPIGKERRKLLRTKVRVISVIIAGCALVLSLIHVSSTITAVLALSVFLSGISICAANENSGHDGQEQS